MRTTLPLASLLFSLAPDCTLERSGADGVRCKCAPSVQVRRVVHGDAVPVEEGAALSEGDRLQLCFTGIPSAGERVLESWDGTERGSLVHRWEGSEERDGCAPFTLLLDDAPGPERLLISVESEQDEPLSFHLVFPKAQS